MAISQLWSCLEIIVHRVISSSLDVIALFGIDQEQQDKLVQTCIAAIRYAEAACSSGTCSAKNFLYDIGARKTNNNLQNKICCQQISIILPTRYTN
jgi:hypothetical protein